MNKKNPALEAALVAMAAANGLALWSHATIRQVQRLGLDKDDIARQTALWNALLDALQGRAGAAQQFRALAAAEKLVAAERRGARRLRDRRFNARAASMQEKKPEVKAQVRQMYEKLRAKPPHNRAGIIAAGLRKTPTRVRQIMRELGLK